MIATMIDTVVRRADDADVHRIFDILRELASVSEFTPRAVKETHLANNVAALLVNRDCAFFLAEREGRTVGILVVLRSADLLSGAPLVSQVCWYVSPEHRNGVGLALLAEAEAWAASCGAPLEMTAPTEAFAQVYWRRGYAMKYQTFERRA